MQSHYSRMEYNKMRSLTTTKKKNNNNSININIWTHLSKLLYSLNVILTALI